MSDSTALIDDLEYLKAEAFEFELTFNPHAGGHEPVQVFIEDRGIVDDDWVSPDQKEIALQTKKFIGGSVYPNGSVSFFEVFGTDVADVVSKCARLCREDRARFQAAMGYSSTSSS